METADILLVVGIAVVMFVVGAILVSRLPQEWRRVGTFVLTVMVVLTVLLVLIIGYAKQLDLE